MYVNLMMMIPEYRNLVTVIISKMIYTVYILCMRDFGIDRSKTRTWYIVGRIKRDWKYLRIVCRVARVSVNVRKKQEVGCNGKKKLHDSYISLNNVRLFKLRFITCAARRT